MKNKKRDKLIRLLAEVLQGLQVPIMTRRGSMLLGTAFAPYLELLPLLGMGVDEVEDYDGFIERLERCLN